MPPIIGAAIGFMMSEPTPVLHRIGTSAVITTLTVISFGRNRSTDPASVASRMSCAVMVPPSRSRLSSASLQSTLRADYARLDGEEWCQT